MFARFVTLLITLHICAKLCLYGIQLLLETRSLIYPTYTHDNTRKYSVGLALHTFHGNCFVRSIDLLALPNVNPDHSFAIQLSYEESLDDVEVAFLQSALLYTSVRGERRIRVATIALPVTTVCLVGFD